MSSPALVLVAGLAAMIAGDCAWAASAEEDAPTLEVKVQGIRPGKGEIGIAVFSSRTGYPVHIEHAHEAEWLPLKEGQGAVASVFDSLAPGEYAVSVVHDENGNRKVDRTAVGFPKEGVGFSNGQKVTLKAPSYQKSKFKLSAGETKSIVITLDYRR